MLIQQIQAGKIIKIELAEEKKSYEINARVLGSNTNGIYIPCITYNGEPLSPEVFTRSGFTINVYCADPDSNEWIGWANVSMEISTHNGQKVYRIWTSHFNSLARSADRREHERITLDIHGTMSNSAIPGTFHVNIKNISDNGIAFTTRDALDILHSQVRLRFSEVIRDTEHELVFDGECVRTQRLDNCFLYGCKVSRANRDVLAYIYLKKILAKKEEKGDKE